MQRCVLLVLLVAGGAAEAQRRALVVSSHAGRADQPQLRFTSNDASRVRDVLAELGAFAEDVPPLVDGSRDEVLTALKGLGQAAPFDVFLFYYSGHGDAGGLWLGESYLETEEMLAAVNRVPADLRIVVLDACQSGGATRRKGVTLGPPVEVRIDQHASDGLVVIASSSVEQASFESDTVQGAVFTLQLVSGLRGAADEDDDGSVTLSEAYAYAAARTIRATLFSPTGPQRPVFRLDFTGRSEPVLTRLARAGRLNIRSVSGGSFFVFDESETELLSELTVGAGQQGRVMLRPGTYVVRARGEREVRTARVKIVETDDRILDDSQMSAAPLVRLARKGAIARLAPTIAGGPAFLSLGSMQLLSLRVGLDVQRGWATIAVEGEYLSGSEQRNGLSVVQRGGSATVSWLPGVSIGRATARAGVALGVLALEQQVTARAATFGVLGRGALRARLEVEVYPPVSLLVGGDVGLVVGPVDHQWSALPFAAASIGLGFAL